MNPITAEIARIAPDYTLSRKQLDQIAAAEKPALVAERLAERIESWRQGFAEACDPPFDPEIIPVETVLDVIDLSQAIRGYSMSLSYMQSSLGRKGNFDLGRMVGMAENPHPIDRAYRNLLGREPDPAGRDFYAGLFDAGDFTVNQMLADIRKNGDQLE